MKNFDLLHLMPPNIRRSRADRGSWARGYRERKHGDAKISPYFANRYKTNWQHGWDRANAEIFVNERQT